MYFTIENYPFCQLSASFPSGKRLCPCLCIQTADGGFARTLLYLLASGFCCLCTFHGDIRTFREPAQLSYEDISVAATSASMFSTDVKKKDALITQENLPVDETALLDRVSAIIENRKYRAAAYANREVTLMFWEVGQHINSVILGGERAEYGKRIVSELAKQLSWTHFCETVPLKTYEARLYYAKEVALIRHHVNAES